MICVEKSEQLKQNKHISRKQKSQSAGIHYMVCMENGGTIKHGLLSENHIRCKTGRKIVMKEKYKKSQGISCNETPQNKRSKETQ